MYRRHNINHYKLKDYNGEFITGSFYESELPKIIPTKEFKIEQVLRTKGRGVNKKDSLNGKIGHRVSIVGFLLILSETIGEMDEY